MIFKILLISTTIFLSACNNNQEPSTGGNLSVSITLDNLPDSITYNKPTTPDGRIEYNWRVTFDITGDGAINQGDIILQVLQFKAPGSTEQTGAINDLEADLWVYTTDTQTTSASKAILLVTGNIITLSIDISAHETLEKITESTLVYFESSTYDPIAGVSEYDYHPSYFTLMNIPSDASFTDPQGDTPYPYIDILSIRISL